MSKPGYKPAESTGKFFVDVFLDVMAALGIVFGLMVLTTVIANKTQPPVPLIQPVFCYGQAVTVNEGFYKGLQGKVVDVIDALDPPIKTPVKKYKILFSGPDAPESEYIRPELLNAIPEVEEVNNSILPGL